MPELPEVEVLVRHLRLLLLRQTVRTVEVYRAKVLASTSARQFTRALTGATFTGLERRGKYLLFTLCGPERFPPRSLVGHLGMTGRMFLQSSATALPKHAAIVLGLGPQVFVFEDTRYFGRLTLDRRPLERLGPEPLDDGFTWPSLAARLKRSTQPIKVKLLDQSLVAGIGNIYASEALFRAGISPRTPARRLKSPQVERLWHAIRGVLTEAIAAGSTVPFNFSGAGGRDGLFYFGRGPGAPADYYERLRVYDRAGEPCGTCGASIRRVVQAARSTFYCPACQR